MLPDIDRITRLLEEAAAEEIVPRFRSLADGEVRRKQGGEVVTVADEATEARLSAALSDLMPGSTVVGEEAAARDPAVLERLSEDRPVWIIDPVDGTANFANGVSVFAVMLAFLREGEIKAAWIHDPLGARTGVAEVDEGAWMAGRRLAVAEARPLAEMQGTLHASQHATPEMARQVQRRRDRLQAIKSLRCAGAEYLRLASGEMHFSLFTKMAPWDHAPGNLIHREAGGVALMLDGRAYDAARPVKGLLMAPDEASWRVLHDTLFGD